MYQMISYRGMRTYPPRGAHALRTIPSQSAIGKWERSFHTARGGFNEGGFRFRPRVLGVEETWKDV